jgi:uncharacterized membrane protein
LKQKKQAAPVKSEPAAVKIQPQKATMPPRQIRESWFQTWLRNNPDLEKFIGENLVNKIGIAVLILGISFFVKYAIDQDWINEVGRVCIGLLCGVILTLLSYRLRKNYRSFSSVLVGGGLTVFYFTIAFAFHQYQLISQSAAFLIMIIITAFAVILSILYDRMELGILATIGGFVTPFLVSTGQGNYVVLFTYLCILNAGLIVLALYKRWHVLHFIAFAFTAVIYGAWIITNTTNASFPYGGTFLFGTAFYIMFLTMSVLLYVKKEVRLNFPDAALLILVNLGYYASGIFLLQHRAPMYKGLFTASLGVVNLLLATTFYRRKNIDRNLIYLFIGATLTFISLTAPVQLQGHYITMFWAAEMVLLLWLYQKSFIRLLKVASLLITLLALISLLMDWVQVYISHSHLLPVIINKGFTTTVFVAACMGSMLELLKKEGDTFYIGTITNNSVRLFYLIACVVLFFMAGVLEISYQFNSRFTGTGLHVTYLSMYITAYVIILLQILSTLDVKTNEVVRLGIPVIPLAFYLANIESSYTTEKMLLQTGNYRIHYLSHWIAAILVLLLIWQTVKYVKENHERLKPVLSPFTTIAAIMITILLSIETRNLYVWMMYRDITSIAYAENIFNKAGLSIVWGLLSFAFIWLGMHYGYKILRIIALLLFGITLIKLFVFDLKDIPPGGKILAFILLGVLLLTVSFMYQRVKKLIIDDAPKN